MNGKHHKVIAAMSGGVDSSVAAALLVEAGYEVIGVHFRLPVLGQPSPGRPDHAADAQTVCDALGIELTALDVDLSSVVDYFLDEYTRGRTPNPCLMCNPTVKFRLLMDLADERGADFIATGHHVRIGDVDGRVAIQRSVNTKKDQSYALSRLPVEFLPRIMFPIGGIASKDEVRRMALGLGLTVHDKPDSQEICFMGGADYVSLLASERPEALQPGPIVDSTGKELARHEGYARFTIGQRRGLKFAAGTPIYVTKIDPASATITIGQRDELMTKHLKASGANWQQEVFSQSSQFDGNVQIRYNHTAVPGKVTITGEGTFEVAFDEDVSAVTPGQAAVVYDGNVLLGGGWIE